MLQQFPVSSFQFLDDVEEIWACGGYVEVALVATFVVAGILSIVDQAYFDDTGLQQRESLSIS